ncbi:MAG TPA: hypothetical protein VKU19_18795 [Bryobacteraceae bacterium]|nr:hypothetical protein [Bryobacteraceae bacterium]
MRFRMLPGLIVVLAAAIALVMPFPPPAPTPVREPSAARRESSVDDQLRRRVDEWITRNGLNEYGDPQGTMYTGSTPLFDERTGAVKDRYQYILEQHPELRDDGSRKR